MLCANNTWGTYINCATVIALELDNRLAARLILDAVLGPEPGHDLDGVPTRHCGA